jgi:5'-methylthioadenosine phosphorylase
VEVTTPFGPPSAPITLANWQGQRIAFLPRHGEGHLLGPSAVPYRANIFALKTLGVTHIIASGATGSLREPIAPGHLVIPDQVIDRTIHRTSTFFDAYLAVHVAFSEPFCNALRCALLEQAAHVPATVHDCGVYVCMEGPQFSSRAESHLHRSWGGDLIGMTCMPEAKLAREAEMCYALVALPTDYDCWRPASPDQSPDALLEEIGRNLASATARATSLIQATVAAAGQLPENCPCHNALSMGLWSDRTTIDRQRVTALKPLLCKYLDFEG